MKLALSGGDSGPAVAQRFLTGVDAIHARPVRRSVPTAGCRNTPASREGRDSLAVAGSDATKHVQTELSEDEYERFREFAREHGLSLKEAGHEALVEWIERQRRPDPNDPAFTVLEDLESDSATESRATDARDEDDLVDEWHGSDESFTLADDPPAQS